MAKLRTLMAGFTAGAVVGAIAANKIWPPETEQPLTREEIIQALKDSDLPEETKAMYREHYQITPEEWVATDICTPTWER